MSPPLLKRAAARRHPFSVSASCHNRPGDAPCAAPCTDAGDGPCLDDAFRRHGAALLRYLGRRAGPDAAPDLMQDVFARAAGSPQRDRLVNPGGFLRRIAQNLLIDRARRQQRDNVLLFPLAEEQHGHCAAEQEQGLEAGDMLRLYEDAVEKMPPKTRRVFLMHRVDELSYRAIHQELGISVATVEYHMMKALAQIAAVLDDHR